MMNTLNIYSEKYGTQGHNLKFGPILSNCMILGKIFDISVLPYIEFVTTTSVKNER